MNAFGCLNFFDTRGRFISSNLFYQSIWLSDFHSWLLMGDFHFFVLIFAEHMFLLHEMSWDE